ncbi:MAG: hypothetical protein QOF35_1702 [Actinomycetota bacterium]|nr:hypothetical protein [Actinomycetota bacterium]
MSISTLLRREISPPPPAMPTPLPPLQTSLQPAAENLPITQLRKRDRYIDTLRALALIRVMTYHAFGWAWLPILFPSIGIMFALAGSLMAGSLDRSPGNPWRVLKRRTIRLLPPLWLLGLVCVPVMLVAGWTYSSTAGAPLSWKTLLFWIVPISDPPGSQLGDDVVTPLWYIRCYLWFLLLSPAALWLFRHWPKRMMAMPVIFVLMSAVGLVPLKGRSGDVALSIAMFGGCWMLGFAHHDNKIRQMPLVQVLFGGASLMGLGLTWALNHGDRVTSYDISYLPVADTLYSLGAVLILLRLHASFSWMGRRELLDKLVLVISSRAMTIYLWGNVAIFLSGLLLDRWTLVGDLNQKNALGYLQITLAFLLLLVVFVFAFGWCEDLAARRPPRLNPWPRSKQQMLTMRTRRVLAFPHPSWLPDLAPKRLFVVTSCLVATTIVLSAGALIGTSTPGRTVTADAPSRRAVTPRPDTKPPDNLGEGNRAAVSKVRPTPPAAKSDAPLTAVPKQVHVPAPNASAPVTKSHPRSSSAQTVQPLPSTTKRAVKATPATLSHLRTGKRSRQRIPAKASTNVRRP